MGRGAVYGKIVLPVWNFIKFPLLYTTIILIVGSITYRIIKNKLEQRRRSIKEVYWALKEAEEKRRKLEAEQREARELAERRRQEQEIEKKRLEERRRELEYEAEERRIFEKNVRNVFNFFLKNKNKDYINVDHRFYDENIIEEARKKYDQYWAEYYERKEEERKEFELKKKCFLFVYHHNYLPHNLFREEGWQAEEFLEEAIFLKSEGKLKEYINQYFNVPIEQDYESVGGEENVKKLLKSSFHSLKELNANEILFLKKFCDYKETSVSIFGERFEKGLIKSASNESDNHIILKYLFGKMHKTAVIEYSITKNVESPVFVDVAFNLGKTKVAVEIERGTNKKEYFKGKIKVLEKFFDKILIVVTRNQKKRYKEFNDGENVFVMTPKEARKQLKKWIKASHLSAPRKMPQNVEKPQESQEFAVT